MNAKQVIFPSPEMELAEMVITDSSMLLLLEHFGIHLPLQGKTVRKVCEEKKINVDLFIAFSRLYGKGAVLPPLKLSYQDIPAIIEYLKNSHRYYLEEIYPCI